MYMGGKIFIKLHEILGNADSQSCYKLGVERQLHDMTMFISLHSTVPEPSLPTRPSKITVQKK